MRMTLMILCFALGCRVATAASDFVHPGGLHTAKQLSMIKSRRDTQPHKQNCDQLISQAREFLSVSPRPLENFNVPYFYFNKEASMAAKQSLSDDAFAAYTLALAYHLDDAGDAHLYADKAVEILNAWAKTNRKVSGFDGDLTACYCGVPLVLAAELLSGYSGWTSDDRELLRQWVLKTIAKSAEAIKRKNNNHGCWGLYVSLVCNHYLDDKAAFEADVSLLKRQISHMIDDKGELPAENKRTNSGLWYTYFALCPMSLSAAIATNVTGEDYFNYTDAAGRGLKPALDRFFAYCKNPEVWPYERPSGLSGAVYNLFYPSADYLKLPQPNSWPGNLYEVMNGVYQEKEWEAWLKPYRPIHSGRGWMWATVFSER